MPTLFPWEAASLLADHIATLTDLCTVQRVGDDGEYDELVSGVICKYVPVVGRGYRDKADEPVAAHKAKVNFAPGQDIKRRDRIIFQDLVLGEISLDVVQVEFWLSDEQARTAICEQVT